MADGRGRLDDPASVDTPIDQRVSDSVFAVTITFDFGPGVFDGLSRRVAVGFGSFQPGSGGLASLRNHSFPCGVELLTGIAGTFAITLDVFLHAKNLLRPPLVVEIFSFALVDVVLRPGTQLALLVPVDGKILLQRNQLLPRENTLLTVGSTPRGFSLVRGCTCFTLCIEAFSNMLCPFE